MQRKKGGAKDRDKCRKKETAKEREEWTTEMHKGEIHREHRNQRKWELVKISFLTSVPLDQFLLHWGLSALKTRLFLLLASHLAFTHCSTELPLITKAITLFWRSFQWLVVKELLLIFCLSLVISNSQVRGPFPCCDWQKLRETVLVFLNNFHRYLIPIHILFLITEKTAEQQIHRTVR